MKYLQEFIDNKKMFYAYEYTLNYIYTLIRMYTGYRIRNIFLLVILFLFSTLIFFFYKEFYTLILKDPLLGITLILILCGFISYLQFNLGCRIIITLTKGIPHFLNISANKDNMLLFLGFMIYNLFLVYFSFSIIYKTSLLLYWYDSTLFDLFYINNLLISTVLLSSYLYVHYEGYSLTMSQKYKIGNGLLIRSFILLMPLIIVLGAYYSDFNQFNLFNVVHCDSVDHVLPGPDIPYNQGGKVPILNKEFYKTGNYGNLTRKLSIEYSVDNNSYWSNVQSFNEMLKYERDANKIQIILNEYAHFFRKVKYSSVFNSITLHSTLKGGSGWVNIFNNVPVFYNGTYEIGHFDNRLGVLIDISSNNTHLNINQFWDNSMKFGRINQHQCNETMRIWGGTFKIFTMDPSIRQIAVTSLLEHKNLITSDIYCQDVVYYPDLRAVIIRSGSPEVFICDNIKQLSLIYNELNRRIIQDNSLPYIDYNIIRNNTEKRDIVHRYLEDWENKRIQTCKIPTGN